MKFFTALASACILFITFQLNAQSLNNNTANLSKAKTDFIQSQEYLSKSDLKSYTTSTDSLKGFNEALVKAEFLKKGFSGNEYFFYLNLQKRKFIKTKYGLTNSQIQISPAPQIKPLGGTAVVNVSPCVNEGFELTAPSIYYTQNSVSGWTLSSRNNDSQCMPTNWYGGGNEFEIKLTPISDQRIGIVPHSPLGGYVVAKLNDTLAGTTNMTKLAQSFPVTSANAFFQFAFAGYWESGAHNCCDDPAFEVIVKDCNGNLLSCSLPVVRPYNPTCTSSSTSYTFASFGAWTNWQVKSIDLTPYIGSCVTIEVIASDCSAGGHFGYVYFDAVCGSQFAPIASSSMGSSLGGQVNMCSGSSYATIQAPIGYSTYTWVAPGSTSISANQSSLSALSLTNGVAGDTYTVYYGLSSTCQYTATYTLTNSSVGISGIGSVPSCSLGTSGSATVVGGGSGSGYNYSWTNATNSVISTSSVITNVPAGNYSVTISAIGSPGCGTASSSVSVSIKPLSQSLVVRPYCGAEAYLTAPTGTNYQWYTSTSVISSTAGGTAASYTAVPLISGTSYWLTYTTPLGCKDSIRYNLTPLVNGTITTATAIIPCYLGSNGSAVLSLTPAPTATTAQNSFSIFSSVNTYSAYSGVSSSTQYTATNMASGSYSLIIFDGLCKYISAFSIPTHPSIPFSLSPFGSPTVCSGNNVSAAVLLPQSLPASMYTYSWSPPNFLLSNTLQQNIITPTVSPGTSLTLVYSVQVTPTAINCPETKTVSFTVVNVLPPTINSIPQLCANSNSYIITALPTGGLFSSTAGLSSAGIISPSLATLGIHQFTYAINIGTCVASSTASFSVSPTPTVIISGSTSLCAGQSTTITATGADNYTWSTSSNSPGISISPILTTSYSALGLDASSSCSSTAFITVTVLSLPAISISGPTSICEGETATLSASGANTYLWNTNSSDTSILINPAATSVYSVNGTSTANGCAGVNSHTVSVQLCAGLYEKNFDDLLIVYPNPGTGKFILESSQAILLRIYDPLGRLISEENFEKGNHEVDLETYADGIYIFRVISGNEFKVIKLVKHH